MKYYSIAKPTMLQQIFHVIQIVIHLVSIGKTNHKPFKVPFKTQPIAFAYELKGNQ